MDEKYEKVEVVDSDSEDEAENTVPRLTKKITKQILLFSFFQNFT